MNDIKLLEAQLPTGWSWQRISDRYRITKKPRGLLLADYDVIPFVPMEAVPSNGREDVRYELRPSTKIASGTYFEKGDVLLSKITPSFENGKQGLGKNLSASFGVASTEIIPLQPLDNENNSRFLFYYLLHPEVRTALAGKMEGSTGRQRVPEHAVRDFPLPVPPKSEQEKIAAVLWKVQRAIEVEEKLIATARELKHSAMRELFTRGLRGEPQKETDIGPLPESWSVLPFEKLREFLQYGTSTKCDYQGKGNPVIRIPNIIDGKVSTADLKWCELPDKVVASLLLELGDLLFVRTNGVRERVGSCAVYQDQPEDALFASYLIRARVKQGELDPNYFQYFTMMQTGAAQLSGRASPAADGKFNINTKTIDSVLVALPDPNEQREIVAILQAIDRKISVHERKRATLQELFKTLLHQLMTGQIRVHDLDIDTSDVEEVA